MNHFPKELEFARDYSLFLNNLILSLWESAEDSKVFNHTIKFENPAQTKKYLRVFETRDSIQFRKWMFENDKLTDLYFLTLKSVIRGLVWDFHSYAYEALENILRGKYSVAYTLLRKPFKENLFLLEWIVADSFDFMTKYNFFDSDSYAPLSFFGKKKETYEIIEKAISKIQFPYFSDPSFIYELRYDKSQFYSFDQLWNLSTHLVTSRNKIKTESFNLNFIFSNEIDERNQLYHLFSLLPLLLFYANEIIESSMKSISHIKEDNIASRRVVGLLAWVEEKYIDNRYDCSEIKKDYKEFRKMLNHKCPSCNKNIKMDSSNMKLYCLDESIKCSKCGKVIEVLEKAV
jgi:hypothetical protein